MAVLVHSEMLYLKSRARLHMQRRLKPIVYRQREANPIHTACQSGT